VRGVASSRVTARKGFYATLVGLLSAFSFLTVEDVLAALKKELHSANSSKSVRFILLLGAVIYETLVHLLYAALVALRQIGDLSSQDIPTILWNPKVQSHFHKSQVCPIHYLLPCFFEDPF